MENRIDPVAAPPAAVSPTGTPLIPARFVPHALALLGVLGAVASLPTLGISLIPLAICHGALVGTLILGPILGVASPGLRK
jgi:hypothetical protein